MAQTPAIAVDPDLQEPCPRFGLGSLRLMGCYGGRFRWFARMDGERCGQSNLLASIPPSEIGWKEEFANDIALFTLIA